MDIVFIVKNKGIVSPSDLDYRRFNKGSDSDLAHINEDARKTYGDNYIGMFDYYVFDIDGEKIELLSQCSYERIWDAIYETRKDSPLKQYSDYTYIFGQKDEGRLDRRKYLRMSSLSTVFRKADEGSPYKGAIGQKDPKFQAMLYHDLMMYVLNILFYQLQKHDQSIKWFEKTLKSVNYYRERLESFDAFKQFDIKPEGLDWIFGHIEKELETYKQKSFVDKIFKK